jgi:hypothetical protein
VSLAVELERAVEGDDRVLRQVARQDVRVDRYGFRSLAARYDCVEAPPDAK